VEKSGAQSNILEQDDLDRTQYADLDEGTALRLQLQAPHVLFYKTLVLNEMVEVEIAGE
jgi:hypothetical protein